jgi:hypothetical protein
MILCSDVITLLYAYNSKTDEQIFIKFGMNIMSL